MTVVNLDAARAARSTLDLFSVRRPCGAKYGPRHDLSEKQSAALTNYVNRIPEVLYGGALYGGKTDWLLLAALQYVCVPKYRALLMRQTAPQLTGDDGLIPRAFDWLAGTDARWHASNSVLGANVWEFPSGATVRFGHAGREAEALNFASNQYQMVGFDELTNWPTARVYQYIGFARVRYPGEDEEIQRCPTCGLSVFDIPLRVRAGTNPIGPGVPWVKARYRIGYDDSTAIGDGRLYIPAAIDDNPGASGERRDAYIARLRQGLDPIELERALNGDWRISEAGRMFERAWFTEAA